MAGRKVEAAGFESFTLKEYSWRSGCLKSPLTGETMRGVVGKDEQGRYRPGIRVSDGKDTTTTFDVAPAKTKKDAISESRAWLRRELMDHARSAAELTQKPGEIVEVRIDSRSLAIAEHQTLTR
jgi:hypothetical protein